MPSDHLIPDVEAFNAAVTLRLEGVRDGQFVTFGIQPTRAETAYGYLKTASNALSENPVGLQSFTKKPSIERAEAMLEEGGFLWNASIFLARPTDLIQEFETHAAEIAQYVRAAIEAARPRRPAALPRTLGGLPQAIN